MSKVGKILEIEAFLKEAFCTDGICTFTSYANTDELDGMVFELNDSKKGKFWITMQAPRRGCPADTLRGGVVGAYDDEGE